VGERVLLIEDDSRLADMVGEYLGKAGFQVVHAESGARGLALHGREPLDVVILDLMLPDSDGLDICRQIRARSDTPILMLTARGDPMDRVVGLEMGADDYLPKPFEPRELLARLRAILRRGRGGLKPDLLRYGRLEIDRGAREVRLDGTPRPLTSYQFALLLALAEHAGRVMSRRSRTIRESRGASSPCAGRAMSSPKPRSEASRAFCGDGASRGRLG